METVVGLGTRTVSSPAAGDLQLHCSVFVLDDRDRSYDEEREEEVTRITERKAHGLRCDAVAAADTGAVLWRLRSGVVPPMDSVALVYDSLVTAESVDLGPFPPLTLDRVGGPGEVGVRYRVEQVARRYAPFPLRLEISRDDGVPLAVVHAGTASALDTSPEARPEEVRALRLITALLQVTVTELVQGD